MNHMLANTPDAPWNEGDGPSFTCPECLTEMDWVDEREYVCPECGYELIDDNDYGFDPDFKHDES